MTDRALRFAFVVSSEGSAMHEVLKSPFLRSRVHLVVVDHEGLAHDKAIAHGVPVLIIAEESADRFSRALLPVLQEHAIDYVFSFYMKFYNGELRAAFEDRILNFHPSLLPAFKGDDGFGDSVAYPARFAGNTVELIADAMDEGKILMQTVCAIDETAPIERTRHRVFVQQCQALLQTAHWLQDGRIEVRGRRVVVAGARFGSDAFSPELEAVEALSLEPPDPFSVVS